VTADPTIPAVMVGVASSVLLCAFFLYWTDVKERWRHEQAWSLQHMQEHEKAVEEPMPTNLSPILPPFRQEQQQPEYIEELSLSPVSTMTASLVLDTTLSQTSKLTTELSESHWVSQDTSLASLVDLSCASTSVKTGPLQEYLEREDTNPPESPPHIHEDEEENESGWSSHGDDDSSEVSIGTYLKSVHSSKSKTSSASGRASNKSRKDCLMEELSAKKESSLKDSTVSSSAPKSWVVRRWIGLDQWDALEQVYAKRAAFLLGVPPPLYDEESQSTLNPPESLAVADDENVRVIYCKVSSAAPDGVSSSGLFLGLDLEDASTEVSFPFLAAMDASSPIADRISVGDWILAVNNQDTIGMTAADVMDLFAQATESRSDERISNDTGIAGSPASDTVEAIIKLTVLSNQADGSISEASSVTEETDQEAVRDL